MEELSLSVKHRVLPVDSILLFGEKKSKTSVFVTNYEIYYITYKAHLRKIFTDLFFKIFIKFDTFLKNSVYFYFSLGLIKNYFIKISPENNI